MRLKRLEIFGFKSFAKKATLEFTSAITSVVGPNGSGKSNVAEAIRFVLGEQSMKSMRGKRGEDLIFNGSKTMGRMNRGEVAIVFDNRERTFTNIDFDEVSVMRVVHRDGTNEYFINGSQVRLKDVYELLAFARIGASGHHIISQGEADRVLSANAKERREMIEDALGLRVYYYKRLEAERKLQKTEENMKEAESLRRELAPHIKFLKKQMERIREAEELRIRLTGIYREYLKREEVYVNGKKQFLISEREAPFKELGELDARISSIRNSLEQTGESSERTELLRLDEALRNARQEKDERSRSIGRIEGIIEAEERRIKKLKDAQSSERTLTLRYNDISQFTTRTVEALSYIESLSELSQMREAAKELKGLVADFFNRVRGTEPADINDAEAELVRMRGEKAKEEYLLKEITARLASLEHELTEVNRKMESAKERSREEERGLYSLMNRRGELSLKLEKIAEEERAIERATRDLEHQMGEAGVLVGRAVLEYSQVEVDVNQVLTEPREKQDERRRDIERAKIRLEDLGAQGGEEVVKEYTETTERDQFLERELIDLAQSRDSLMTLIKELNDKLDIEFKEGIKKINTQFREFFSLMFGGGVAELQVVDIVKRRRGGNANTDGEDEDEAISIEMEEEQEAEQGIDIHVSLPHKKIRGLQMLSGGERALTSIALLFAISQVNPPPFMVLDETDAALDEANSRKYGDMIENLARFSQLVVITHNRETMSRAGILYGITMGSDAVSKLLSINFEEATQVAK